MHSPENDKPTDTTECYPFSTLLLQSEKVNCLSLRRTRILGHHALFLPQPVCEWKSSTNNALTAAFWKEETNRHYQLQSFFYAAVAFWESSVCRRQLQIYYKLQMYCSDSSGCNTSSKFEIKWHLDNRRLQWHRSDSSGCNANCLSSIANLRRCSTGDMHFQSTFFSSWQDVAIGQSFVTAKPHDIWLPRIPKSH